MEIQSINHGHPWKSKIMDGDNFSTPGFQGLEFSTDNLHFAPMAPMMVLASGRIGYADETLPRSEIPAVSDIRFPQEEYQGTVVSRLQSGAKWISSILWVWVFLSFPPRKLQQVMSQRRDELLQEIQQRQISRPPDPLDIEEATSKSHFKQKLPQGYDSRTYISKCGFLKSSETVT